MYVLIKDKSYISLKSFHLFLVQKLLY